MNTADPFSTAKPDTLVHLLRGRALYQPERLGFAFLETGDLPPAGRELRLTYAELDRRARSIAAALQALKAAGERALLLYPPGLDYITGFFGCLYAGVTAVPVYPPDPARLNHTLPRLQAIAADAQASLVLTTSPIQAMAPFLSTQAPDLVGLRWLATDAFPAETADAWQEPEVLSQSLAFLQYTSGSTSAPRGVMLTHANLLHNCAVIRAAFDVADEELETGAGVSWLPPYHDMGLIGMILEPLYLGGPCFLMSPLAFLERPRRWLDAMTHYRAIISGGPNFAYELCVQKITPEERASLDLRGWDIAINGAEPVRFDTLERFYQAFKASGFRREALYPAYGLAESTLFVSGGQRKRGPVTLSLSSSALSRHQIRLAVPEVEPGKTLVGCGRPWLDHQVAIVAPESLKRCQPGEVGEVWACGPSVAAGYWARPEETERTFGGWIAGESQGPYLRTGDLGFIHNGDLYVTGRLKDMILIRGRNIYPQDIEYSIETCHPAARPGGAAAFSIEGIDGEWLVVLQEVDSGSVTSPQALEEISRAIRTAVASVHGLQVYTVALVQSRSLPKTPSGKIQRHACRLGFLEGKLDLIKVSRQETYEAPRPAPINRAELLSLPAQEQKARLLAHLVQQVAFALRLAPAEVDPLRPLASLGIDSIAAVDLAAELESALEIALPLVDLLEVESLKRLAETILEQLPPEAGEEPDQILEEFQLSPGQRALWFLQRLYPNSVAFNVAHPARVRSSLDVSAFHRAFQTLVDRHPALRTTFAAPDGEPVQQVHRRMAVGFQVETAEGWDDAQIDARLSEELFRPYDLEKGPLIRVCVFSRSPQDHVLLLSIHHIVTDMWSLALIMYEVFELYRQEVTGTPANLKPPKGSYRDHVERQAALLAGPQGELHWAYWQERLSGELPVLDLVTDHPRPPLQTDRAAGETLRFGRELTERLRALSREHGTQLYLTALAALQVLLYRYTGQEDLLVGFAKAGRSRDMARTIGYFINQIPLRADLSGEPSFSALLDRTRAGFEADSRHDEYPFIALVERLQPRRDPSRSPLFQVALTWQKTTNLVDRRQMGNLALGDEAGGMALGGLFLEAVSMPSRVTQTDLTLWMAENDDELAATLEYNTALFEPATARRMLAHYGKLLESIAANPDQPISWLDLLSSEERRQLLVEWNQVNRTNEPNLCVHQAFEAQVRRSPQATAVKLGEATLTYAELNRRSNLLAQALRQRGVGPETLVAISVERSFDQVIGLLGILKAGGAYLPIDPAYPLERIAFMLDDAAPPVLLTQQRLLNRLPLAGRMETAPGQGFIQSNSNGLLVVCLDCDWEQIEAGGDGQDGDSGVGPDSLAYAIFTSGSTGRPKGVLLQHAGLANLVAAQTRGFGVQAGDRVLQFASFSFDASVSEIFMALLSGATLVLASQERLASPLELLALLKSEPITVVTLPPSLLRVLPDMELPGLRVLISAGESCPWEVAERWAVGRRFFNAYGPTETTIGPTYHEVQAAGLGKHGGAGTVPIGRPIANMAVYVLDGRGELAPVGAAGELYIGGIGLARGYLNRPELTGERFVELGIRELGIRGEEAPDSQPVVLNGRIPNSLRVYRTGDLGRWLPGGELEFLGRVDQQVKLRGFRIELGEIESALDAHPAVQESVVLVREETPGDFRLAAFVVPEKNGHNGHPPKTAQENISASELRSSLKRMLPEYMLPASFTLLDQMPYTPNGKVDRRALARLPIQQGARPVLEAAFVQPQTGLERSIAAVWQAVLGIEKVGVNDNFFDLGGHSLLLVKTHGMLQEALNRTFSMIELFRYPTVRLLADFLGREEESSVAAQRGAERADRQKEALANQRERLKTAAQRRVREAR